MSGFSRPSCPSRRDGLRAPRCFTKRRPVDTVAVAAPRAASTPVPIGRDLMVWEGEAHEVQAPVSQPPGTCRDSQPGKRPAMRRGCMCLSGCLLIKSSPSCLTALFVLRHDGELKLLPAASPLAADMGGGSGVQQTMQRRMEMGMGSLSHSGIGGLALCTHCLALGL